jgi:hypothetical protein
MNLDRLRRMHQARPFQSFVMHLADGHNIPVDHPEMMSIALNGRTAAVFQRDNTFSLVDVMLITELEVKPAPGKPKRRPARA